MHLYELSFNKKGYVTMNEVPASEIMNLLEKKENILVTLEEEMREAAKNLDFERAMELRDILLEMKSN